MEMGIKIFTRESANEVLPTVRDLLHELRGIRAELQSKEIDIDVAMLLASDDGKRMDKNAPAGVSRDISHYNEMVEEFNQVTKRFAELGVELKDLDQGLVDFYTMHEGNLAYLCWKEGDKSISHWHSLEGGFANRRPL